LRPKTVEKLNKFMYLQVFMALRPAYFCAILELQSRIAGFCL
jgi:hypothetical protein